MSFQRICQQFMSCYVMKGFAIIYEAEKLWHIEFHCLCDDQPYFEGCLVSFPDINASCSWAIGGCKYNFHLLFHYSQYFASMLKKYNGSVAVTFSYSTKIKCDQSSGHCPFLLQRWTEYCADIYRGDASTNEIAVNIQFEPEPDIPSKSSNFEFPYICNLLNVLSIALFSSMAFITCFLSRRISSLGQ